MRRNSRIKSVTALELVADRGHPGVETTVETEDGAIGSAIVTAGISIGVHEVQFKYDGGERFGGMGLRRVVETIEETIAPALIGVDAATQREVDRAIIELDGTPTKSKLGGNATASVSAAVLKAGAESLGIPLYEHIGGVNACVLPTPGVISLVGSNRYDGGERSGGKPSYSFVCYGFDTFSEAAYACWKVRRQYDEIMAEQFKVRLYGMGTLYPAVPPGAIRHDRELWEVMVKAIEAAGYEGRVGIQVDVAACTYFDSTTGRFVGLFSNGEKTKEELIGLYHEMAEKYHFVVIEDPMDEEDYEGHAKVTREIPAEIVGDDLFTTNPDRLQQGIDHDACDTMLLKVNQIGTISEAFDAVNLAYRNGFGVMPCNSRGEGRDIADYCVGLGTGHVRESGIDAAGHRFLQIEKELGGSAKFLGLGGLKKRHGSING